MNKDYLKSIMSQFFHYVFFSYRKPLPEFDTASLIISIDVDVGSPEVGVRNEGRNDCNVNDFLTESAVGGIEEQVIPYLLRTFDEFEFPATFALRGQLMEVENSIFNSILESSTRHEIASHGYSHKVFTDLSEFEAEEELRMISDGMRKFGVSPKSFVFPKNKVSHLPLLERYGYISFRAEGTSFSDGMYVEKCGSIFNVNPSLFSDFNGSFFSKKIVNLAVKYRAPLHIWFHPWNLGDSSEKAAKRIAKGLVPLIQHAAKKRKEGVLKFETMCSIVEEYKRLERSKKQVVI
jgi:peptidoglycan/xylan/chitin deacetylase (PgdA/CDA1 family)